MRKISKIIHYLEQTAKVKLAALGFSFKAFSLGCFVFPYVLSWVTMWKIAFTVVPNCAALLISSALICFMAIDLYTCSFVLSIVGMMRKDTVSKERPKQHYWDTSHRLRVFCISLLLVEMEGQTRKAKCCWLHDDLKIR